MALLQYRPPEVLSSLLLELVEQLLFQLTVLELGAGNGLFGERLKDKGVEGMIGAIAQVRIPVVNKKKPCRKPGGG